MLERNATQTSESVVDFAEALERSKDVTIDRESQVKATHFEQTRFVAGDHQSSMRNDHSALLILSILSDGTLRSDYEGDKDENTIRPGIFHFVPAGIHQQYDFKGKSTNIVTSLRAGLFERLRDRNPELADIRLDEPLRGFTRPSLAKLIVNQNRLVRSGEMGWRTLAEANTLQLGIELMQMVSLRRVRHAAPLTQNEVALAEAYLRDNLEENIALSDIADLLGRDVFNFSRAFKSATGHSFHQFSLQLRVAEASRLLTKTSMPIAEIAYATGFSSQPHMTTTMKQLLGATPGAIRKSR